MPARRTTSTDQPEQPSRRERKKADTRDRIYDTSIRLFKLTGFDDVTVDAITSEADVAKGTFFNYFPSKLHVLLAYWLEVAEDLIQFGESQHRRSTRAFFKAFFGHLETRVQADTELFEVLVREVMLQPDLRALNEQLTARGFALYRKVLEAGIGRGELKDTIDIDVVCSMIEDAWIGTLRSWVISSHAFRLRSTFEKKLDLLFDGLCPAADGAP